RSDVTLTNQQSSSPLAAETGPPRQPLPSLSRALDVRRQRSTTRGSSFGERALVARGTQGFHLIAQRDHSFGNAFVFLRSACDCAVNGALVHKALKLFVSTQPQQLLTTIGCVSLPQIEQNN